LVNAFERAHAAWQGQERRPSLHTVKPVDLVVGLMHALEERNGADIKNYIDDVVLGCVTPGGRPGHDIAKTAAIEGGLERDHSAGVQLNRFCASGLEAVNLGAMKVRSGFEDLVVVGGVESMSRLPWALMAAPGRWTRRPTLVPVLCRRALAPT
jgi:acetyl-CoA C-acetyltransferase